MSVGYQLYFRSNPYNIYEVMVFLLSALFNCYRTSHPSARAFYTIMSHLPFPKELFEQYAAEYQTKINKSQQELVHLRGQLSGNTHQLIIF